MKNFLENICREAGELTLDYRAKLAELHISAKRDKDYVTEADIATEKFLVEKIKSRYPDHGILGEETGVTVGKSSSRWIIDPIDGTNSFMHGLPFYCVSVGFEQEGEVVLGVVYAPVLDEMFIAEKGKGSFLNGKPIQVSKNDNINLAMVVTGFACLRENKANYGLKLFSNVIPNVRDVRRHGSAALDVCYVACGRFDFFWENFLNIYDLAAAKLILEEAGGRMSDYQDSHEKLYHEIAASNGLLHNELLRLLNM